MRAFFRLTAVAFVLWLAVLDVSGAAGLEGQRDYSLPAGDAVTMLVRFSTESGVELMFSPDNLAGRKTKAIRGRYRALQALRRMLAGTGIEVEPMPGGIVLVHLGESARPEGGDPLSPQTSDAPSKMKTPSLARRAAAAFSALAATLAHSQTSSLQEGDDTVELSPFVVQTDTDVGYVAENTLAGSRLNSRLRDTASSIAVFTKEFLDDAGIVNIAELVEYSVNSELDTDSQGGAVAQNRIIGAHALVQGIQTRGMIASFGMDYFSSITPTDPYRVGRYEDSRGPNSILFGIGAPGGLFNESSKVAVLGRDFGNARYSLGSFGRGRFELDANKVLIPKKLAVSLAALDQENDGWRQFDFQDKERIFGSMTYRLRHNLTFTAMGEIGRDHNAIIRSFSDSEEMLAWYDNREAFGVNAVTVAPTTALPNAALQQLGIVGRDGNRTGNNRRAVFIENDGTVFDAIGTYLSGTYNTNAVRHPDGTPGVTASSIRFYDPDFYPLNMNASGPGMTRQTKLNNYTLSLDWQPTRNLSLNLAHNRQETDVTVHFMNGQNPVLRGDPNRTLGIGGAPNPYAGRLYFDGNWLRDLHYGRSTETRLTASYDWKPKRTWLGRHRIAAAFSRSDIVDWRTNSWLVLAGRPFNAAPSNANNRVTVRYYLDEGNFSTYRAGDWRTLPKTITFNGQTYETAWGNVAAGQDNGGMRQDMDSYLAAVQSTFWGGRIVSTLGYRHDDVDTLQLDHIDDPVRGAIVDLDPSRGILTKMSGRTRTAGLVFHATGKISLIANKSSNVGIPPLARTVFPDGRLAPFSEGEGEDYGVNFDLLEGRVNARLVRFKGSEVGRVTAAGAFSSTNTRVLEALEGALVGAGRPYSPEAWAGIVSELDPPASSVLSDFRSEGYEARVTANLTPNWRLVVNYSYTDSGRSNYGGEVVSFYGFQSDGPVYLQQGVSQDSTGRYVIDAGAYAPGGAVARWLELAAQHPSADPSTLTTSSNIVLAQEILNLVTNLNDTREQQQQRWGVRPHKVSLFTAYDFKSGRLKGLTFGGGYRWRSANIIGRNSGGAEITGRAIVNTDLMIAYTRKFRSLPGRFRFQINVTNIFDKQDIIPSRLSTSTGAPDGFEIPGGRGTAYSRFDLVQPRDVRFTTTYSF